MGNTPDQETRLLDEALSSVVALLPASWAMNGRPGDLVDGRRFDAVVDLAAPSGARVSYAVEMRRSRSAPIADVLSAVRDLGRKSSLPVLFVSDYVGPSLRTALTREGVSFADATGWVRVISDDPLILLTGQGAVRSPRPSGASAVVRLNGVAANRTIRALTTTDLPVGVRSLAASAGVSPGSVSKLLVTLAAESIIDRDNRSRVIAVRRRALIHRWVRDYSFTTTNQPVGYYIAPRGIERTLRRLDDAEVAVALTGSAAARQLLPPGTTSVVPLRLLALYAADPGDLARGVRLIQADPPAANVVVAAPQDPQVLTTSGKDLPIAPTALVLADLLTLPSRSGAEAEQLMDALMRNDRAWKD